MFSLVMVVMVKKCNELTAVSDLHPTRSPFAAVRDAGSAQMR